MCSVTVVVTNRRNMGGGRAGGRANTGRGVGETSTRVSVAVFVTHRSDERKTWSLDSGSRIMIESTP